MPKLKMGWSPCFHSSPYTLLLATLRGLRIGARVLRFVHAHVCTMATCARCVCTPWPLLLLLQQDSQRGGWSSPEVGF